MLGLRRFFPRDCGVRMTVVLPHARGLGSPREVNLLLFIPAVYAVALALIANSPELEPPGVTTVAGDAQARAPRGKTALGSRRSLAHSSGL
jgi:small ligand-binding sensory domain FIST